MSSSFVHRLRKLVVDRQGVLTRELVREPGRFGLGQVPARHAPDATTTAVCGFCSTGCGLDIHLKQGKAVNLSPASDYPVNLGMACPKGWEALSPLEADDRATQPLLRIDGKLQPVDWEKALSAFVDGFKRVQAEHGAHSVAFLGTGQMVTEELAFLGALGKFGMGMLHGDGNTRQCMATAVRAYKESFGFDAPPYTYADYEQSDVLVFVGANPCIAHPIMWERVCRNPNDPTIVVIDPRHTETAQAASLHLPVRPKQDLALLYAVAHVLCERDWIDAAFIEAHCEGFEAFRAHIARYRPEEVAETTGIAARDIERLARLIHEGKRVSFWWTMGVNQSHQGVRTAQAIINLALMTGNIGKPGTGANSITGQCNAMGSRLFSNTTCLLGGREFELERDREHVAGVLGIDVERIPTRASLAYDEIMEAVERGEIRGLWVVATNTAHSWMSQERAREVLNKLDFLVVQDMYHSTDTARQAHLVLPAAGWGEKEGTFINSERRLGVVKQVSEAPGQALSDFRIFRLVAQAWGVGAMFERWSSPEATFQLLKGCSEGMPCDITGIESYAHLDAMRGIQWPLPAGQQVEPSSERRLFEDGRFFTGDGRARIVFEPPVALPEPSDASHPLTLLTGRASSAHWHTQTRTGKSAVLRKLAPQTPYCELHPEDARNLGVEPGEHIVVKSRRGEAEVRAVLTPTVQPGQVFIPMHYEATNRLTLWCVDPYSRQPAYKACAVRIEKLPPT